jgi:membrane protein insertase Oxa1/YidC/SpoIIIJ
MGAYTYLLTFLNNSGRDFHSENNNVSITSITSHQKITLTFETNDEHQARSYQNALRYSVITTFLEFAFPIGLLLYSIWSRLWLSIKALVV